MRKKEEIKFVITNIRGYILLVLLILMALAWSRSSGLLNSRSVPYKEDMSPEELTPYYGERMIVMGLPIDINRATVADLTAIPGIGERFAERIVALREERGEIHSITELMGVRGVGKKRLALISRYAFTSSSVPHPYPLYRLPLPRPSR